VLLGTGLGMRAVQEMGLWLALVLVLLAIPGGLLAAIINPRQSPVALVVGAAVSAAIAFAVYAAVVSRI
jgi:uncharacterized membrane-anchored protein